MCPKFEHKLQSLAICTLFFLFDHYFITVSKKSTIYLHFLLCSSLFFAESSLFIDISLSILDTWGRVCFVHFLDILNTSPSVQNGKVVLYASFYPSTTTLAICLSVLFICADSPVPLSSISHGRSLIIAEIRLSSGLSKRSITST